MTFKDLFSHQAVEYARYRPAYPPELFTWLASTVPVRKLAVDLGTGNGQAACALAEHFEQVIAFDASAAQLANATAHARVTYRQAPAEATGVEAHSVDLAVAAQCLHWFRLDAFFEELSRIMRRGGIFAACCYPLCSISPELDRVVLELYEDYLGAYWEPERRMVEDGYRSVSFPFTETAVPDFEIQRHWSKRDLVGYLSTWSPLKRYQEARGTNPLAEIAPKLEEAWGDAATRLVRWPVLLRVFHV